MEDKKEQEEVKTVELTASVAEEKNKYEAQDEKRGESSQAFSFGSKRALKPRTIPRVTADFRQRDRALCIQQASDDSTNSMQTFCKRAALEALLEMSGGVPRTSRAKDGQRSREV